MKAYSEADTVKIRVTHNSSDNFFDNTDSMISIDTSIDFFHQYEKEFQFDFFFRNNGSTGSPLTRLFFNEEDDITFNTGITVFDRLFSKAGSTQIYDTYTPFFNFNYLQGNLEMQKFEALHSRNINPFINITIDYTSTRNDGFYLRQFSKIKDLNLNTSFHSPNGYYHALLLYQFQHAAHFENGGILNDSLFQIYSAREKLGADVYLTQAEANRKKQILTLKHSLDADIFNPDSSVKKTAIRIRLNHEVSFTGDYYSFKDKTPNPEYYRNFFIDTFATLDSLKMTKITNRIFFSFDKKGNFLATAGIYVENGKVIQNNRNVLFSNTMFEFRGTKKIRSSEIGLAGNYIINGIYAGMFNLKGKALLKPSQNVNLVLSAQSTKKQAPLLQNNLFSNHLKWENQLKPIRWNAFSGTIYWKDFRTQFSLKYSQYKNYVYFNRKVEPEQIISSFSVWQISLLTHAITGNFHFKEHFAYQYNPYSTEFGLPSLLLNSTNYYENIIFKGHLKIQAGFDLRVSDGFYPQSYFAPFGIYYRQDDFFQDVYPVVDIFVNAAVKRMRVFVKYEHVNQGFPDLVYYLRPYYPNDPRTIRFGLDWMFFD